MRGTHRCFKPSFWSLCDSKTLADSQHGQAYLVSELLYVELAEILEKLDFQRFGKKQKIANIKRSGINVKVFTSIFEFPGCISFDFCKNNEQARFFANPRRASRMAPV